MSFKYVQWFRSHKSQGGFSLLEAMITMVVMSIISVGAFSLFGFLGKERARNDFLVTVGSARNQLYGLLENADSWIATRDNNAALACIHSTPSGLCSSGTTATPIILNAVGEPVFDPSTQGFDASGTICTLTSPLCIIRYRIETVLSCGPTSTCVIPAVVTTATLSIGHSLYPVNTARFSFTIIHGYRAGKTPLYDQTCNSWASKGWQSKDECLRDGRIHLIFATDGSGAVTLGSVADLNTHALAGAKFSVGINAPVFAFLSTFEQCSSTAGLSTGYFVCMPAARAQVDDYSTHSISVANTIVYFSDGYLRYSSAAPAVLIPLNWYIKY